MENKTIIKRTRIYWDRVIIAAICLIALLLVITRIASGIFSGNKASAQEQTAHSTEKPEESRPESVTPEKISYDLTVCIDAGHGAQDSGCVNADSTRLEKNDNLAISLRLRDELEKYGVKVIMTRQDDSFLELEQRVETANANNCDLFVCMHRNAYTGSMNGTEIWVSNARPKEDTVLAQNILSAVEKVGINNNRGVCYGYVGDENVNYYVNSHTKMPSCLVELGFLTDESDNKLFDEHIDDYSKAIADAVIKTSVDLGITDKNGKRTAQKPFFTADKTALSKTDTQRKKPASVIYNADEKEY